jgi:hypothetical protein
MGIASSDRDSHLAICSASGKLMITYIERCMRGWIPITAGILVVMLSSLLEPLYFPVVRDWTAETISRENAKVTVSGHMRKTRDCIFLGVSAIGVGRDGNRTWLPLLFRDNITDHTYTRPVGAQGWGPWTMTVPLESDVREVEFRAAHQCHPLWATVTKLGTATIYR